MNRRPLALARETIRILNSQSQEGVRAGNIPPIRQQPPPVITNDTECDSYVQTGCIYSQETNCQTGNYSACDCL